MLTAAEKRFIRDWEFQKEGPKWKYYLQYTIAWTIVTFLALFFVTKFLISNRNIGGWLSFLIFFAIAVVAALFATHLTYSSNEKKLKGILEKENLN